jgi:RNA polymerase sigma-70 factor (ECF subfamily)
MTGRRHELDLESLRRREPEAVERWFESYADRLYAFVFYRVHGSSDAAADVVQEVFVTALARIEDFDPERGQMLPWLTYAARNLLRKERRRQSKLIYGDLWEAVDERLLAYWKAIDETALPDEVLEREETGELVRAALTHLPRKDQMLLEGRYLEEQSIKELAARDGATEGAIKTRLHRARKAFRAAFQAIAQSLAEKLETQKRVLS